MPAMKRNEVPRSLTFFQSVLQHIASQHHFAQCLMAYEHFREELPLDKTVLSCIALAATDKIVLSCIALAATESSDMDTAMEVFEKIRSGKTQCELSGKDSVNLFRHLTKRGDSNAAIELLRSLVGTKIPFDKGAIGSPQGHDRGLRGRAHGRGQIRHGDESVRERRERLTPALS